VDGMGFIRKTVRVFQHNRAKQSGKHSEGRGKREIKRKEMPGLFL
jgi:hypothetical protein